MTGRERFINSLLFKPVDRAARMDGFLLTEEAFGQTFPSDDLLAKSSGRERQALVEQSARLEVHIAEHFDHDAIFAWHPFDGPASLEVIAMERQLVGKSKAIVGLVGGAFGGMELIHDHFEFAVRLADDRPALHEEAKKMQAAAIERVHALAEAGADVAYIPNDQASNSGPYFSPAVYEELVLPYAQPIFAEIRRCGLLGVYHTDGYIMPILDMIIASGAHALQSIDPMAGMDIREVKKRTYGKLALLGNVQCSLLQEGPEDALRASARYCLEHGSPGSGYVFMASNSIFVGMPLSNYLIVQDEYRRFVEENCPATL